MKKKHVLIIVENLPVPFDRRVWLEALALKDAGFKVSIICPKFGSLNLKYECKNDIEIYRHPLPIEAHRVFQYPFEYFVSLFWELALSIKIYLKCPFQIIQGCNPPDLIFIIAFCFKIFKVKFVFDHHDLNPELFLAKFNKKNLVYKFVLLFEKLTFMTANFSIATNESYKKIAISRCKMDPQKIVVVRSGPILDSFYMKNWNSNKIPKKRKYLIGYAGVINEQDGLILLLQIIKNIVFDNERKDIQFVVIGDGPYLKIVKNLSSSMNLDPFVDFLGRLKYENMLEVLSSVDICVDPDEPLLMNSLSTMNKIMDYMAVKKPIVQFDLIEGKFSAAESSFYARDINDFVNKIFILLDNPNLRESMGEFGFSRLTSSLTWDLEKEKLINFYNLI